MNADDWQEHEAIYLSPACIKCPHHINYDGRQWCEDPQDPCEDCGAEWIKFERAALVEGKKAA